MRAGGAASFSPDGRRVVTASGDKTARWEDGTAVKPVGDRPCAMRVGSSGEFQPRRPADRHRVRQDRAGVGRRERKPVGEADAP